MKCLFCKQNTENSRSVEHIIPESLGNKDHILPRGMVCDDCNQYFALKVEKPLLEQRYFRNVRHRAEIENKKGRIPIEDAIVLPGLGHVQVKFEKDKNIILIPDEETAKKIFTKSTGKMIIPILTEPESNNKMLSRFLAKTGVEALLHRGLAVEGWIDEIMDKPELEPIKQYARYGSGVDMWPYHQRRIYSENTRFNDPRISTPNYEVLHEFCFLHTEQLHCYFVIAIMGIEYAISLGGPGIYSYEEWLKENNNASPLDDPLETKVIMPGDFM